MTVVAVLATKGGAGKSTTCVQLAIAAGVEGRSPILMDIDAAQHSAQIWSESLRRKAKLPVIKASPLPGLSDEIAKARRKHDLIFLDVGAGGGDDFRRAASLADILILPVVWDSVFDVQGLVNTVNALEFQADHSMPENIRCMNALGKAAIVINRAPKERNKNWRQQVELSVARCGAGALPIIGVLSDDEIWRSSLSKGLGVAELKDKPQPTAAQEILELYNGLVELEAERKQRIKETKTRRRS